MVNMEDQVIILEWNDAFSSRVKIVGDNGVTTIFSSYMAAESWLEDNAKMGYTYRFINLSE
jgi:hypothetical protein